jgi:hypothetical protein
MLHDPKQGKNEKVNMQNVGSGGANYSADGNKCV